MQPETAQFQWVTMAAIQSVQHTCSKPAGLACARSRGELATCGWEAPDRNAGDLEDGILETLARTMSGLAVQLRLTTMISAAGSVPHDQYVERTAAAAERLAT